MRLCYPQSVGRQPTGISQSHCIPWKCIYLEAPRMRGFADWPLLLVYESPFLICDSDPTLDVTEWKVRMSKQELQHGRARPETILYIEDNPNCLELVTLIIRSRTDYQIVTSTSGREGLEVAFEIVPDLIMIDLQLPDVNGFEILERLQSGSPTSDIPVIIVSAEARKDVVAKCIAAGACDYIVKPFGLQRLLLLVSFHIYDRQMRERAELKLADYLTS
jgi:CheY-like chemotaxis protein